MDRVEARSQTPTLGRERAAEQVATAADAHAGEQAGPPRRLVLVIGAVVFVDTMFYAVIAPLLPSLVVELHLSKLSAGVLTAAYPAGTLIGSLPGGWLAAKWGPRATVYTGLGLMAGSSLAFGFASNIVVLDAARFVQGLGGACTWAGGMAWLISETPRDMRGAIIGGALGAAIAGALFGPVLGTLAQAIGRGPVFSLVVVIALGLALLTRGLAQTHAPQTSTVRELAVALRHPGVMLGMWLTTVPAIVSGLLAVLGPLRLHTLGASAVAIGGTYVAATATEAAFSAPSGRLSDRVGRLVPLRIGLVCVTITLLVFTRPDSWEVLALVIVAMGTSLASFWAPAMALLSEAIDLTGVSQGYGMALTNLAWAAGQIVGAAGGGAVARAHGDGAAAVAAACVCVATLASLWLPAVRRAASVRS